MDITSKGFLLVGVLLFVANKVNGQVGGLAIGLGGGDFMVDSPFGGEMPSPLLAMAAQGGSIGGQSTLGSDPTGAGIPAPTSPPTAGDGFNPTDVLAMLGGPGPGIAVNSANGNNDYLVQPQADPTGIQTQANSEPVVQIDPVTGNGFTLQNEAYTPIGSVGHLVKVPTNGTGSDGAPTDTAGSTQSNTHQGFDHVVVKPVPNTVDNSQAPSTDVANNVPDSNAFNPGSGMADEIAALQKTSSLLGTPVDMSNFLPPPFEQVGALTPQGNMHGDSAYVNIPTDPSAVSVSSVSVNVPEISNPTTTADIIKDTVLAEFSTNPNPSIAVNVPPLPDSNTNTNVRSGPFITKFGANSDPSVVESNSAPRSLSSAFGSNSGSAISEPSSTPVSLSVDFGTPPGPSLAAFGPHSGLSMTESSANPVPSVEVNAPTISAVNLNTQINPGVNNPVTPTQGSSGNTQTHTDSKPSLRDMFSKPKIVTEPTSAGSVVPIPPVQSSPQNVPHLQDLNAEGIYPFEGSSMARDATLPESTVVIQDMNQVMLDHNSTEVLHLEPPIGGINDVPPLTGTNGGPITNLVGVKPSDVTGTNQEPAPIQPLDTPNTVGGQSQPNSPLPGFIIGAGMPNAQLIQTGPASNTEPAGPNTNTAGGLAIGVGNELSNFGLNLAPSIVQNPDVGIAATNDVNPQQRDMVPKSGVAVDNNQLASIIAGQPIPGEVPPVVATNNAEITVSKTAVPSIQQGPVASDVATLMLPGSAPPQTVSLDSLGMNNFVDTGFSPNQDLQRTGGQIQPAFIDPMTPDMALLPPQQPADTANNVVSDPNAGMAVSDPHFSVNRQGLVSGQTNAQAPIVTDLSSNSLSNQQVVSVKPGWMSNVFGGAGGQSVAIQQGVDRPGPPTSTFDIPASSPQNWNLPNPPSAKLNQPNSLTQNQNVEASFLSNQNAGQPSPSTPNQNLESPLSSKQNFGQSNPSTQNQNFEAPFSSNQNFGQPQPSPSTQNQNLEAPLSSNQNFGQQNPLTQNQNFETPFSPNQNFGQPSPSTQNQNFEAPLSSNQNFGQPSPSTQNQNFEAPLSFNQNFGQSNPSTQNQNFEAPFSSNQNFGQPQQSPSTQNQNLEAPLSSNQNFGQQNPLTQNQNFEAPLSSNQNFGQPNPTTQNQNFGAPLSSNQNLGQPNPSTQNQNFEAPLSSNQNFGQPSPSTQNQNFEAPLSSNQNFGQPNPSTQNQNFEAPLSSNQNFGQPSPSTQNQNFEAPFSSNQNFGQPSPTAVFGDQRRGVDITRNSAFTPTDTVPRQTVVNPPGGNSGLPTVFPSSFGGNIAQSPNPGVQIVPLQSGPSASNQNKEIFTLGEHRVINTMQHTQPQQVGINLADYQTQNVLGTSDTKPLVSKTNLQGTRPRTVSNPIEDQLKKLLMLQEAQFAMSKSQTKPQGGNSVITSFEAPGMSLGQSVSVSENFARQPNVVSITPESNVPVKPSIVQQPIAGGFNDFSNTRSGTNQLSFRLGAAETRPSGTANTQNLLLNPQSGSNVFLTGDQAIPLNIGNGIPATATGQHGTNMNTLNTFATGLRLGQPVASSLDIQPAGPNPITTGIMLPMSGNTGEPQFTSGGGRQAVFGSNHGGSGAGRTFDTVHGTSNTAVQVGQLPIMACPYEPDPQSRLYFIRRIDGVVHRLRCALGTAYDAASCECSTRVNDPADCLEVHMDFNNGVVEDSSFNRLPIGNQNVEVTNKSTPLSGIALFNSTSKLTIWRYQNYDFRDHVMLKVQFRPGQVGDRFQPLISNCDGGIEGPSVGIIYDNKLKEVLLVLKAVNETRRELSFPINAEEWNDVTYIYDGQEFIGIVNGIRRYVSRKDPHLLGIIGGDIKSMPARGLVEIRDAGIIMGHCPRYGNYNGAMVDIQIYTCIPKTFRLETN